MVKNILDSVVTRIKSKALVKVPKEVEELVSAMATFRHKCNPRVDRYTYESNGLKTFRLAYTGMSREQRATTTDLVRRVLAVGGNRAGFYGFHPYLKTQVGSICSESLDYTYMYMRNDRLDFIAPQSYLVYGEFLIGLKESLCYILNISSKKEVNGKRKGIQNIT